MRLTISVLFLVLGLLASTSRADARTRTDADTAKVNKLLVHADKISAILEKNLDQPKKALTALDKYLKKNRKKMKKLVADLVVVINELDEEPRGDLARDLMTSEKTQRFMKALDAFKSKYEADATWQPKIDARLEELMTEGKKLVDAIMQ